MELRRRLKRFVKVFAVKPLLVIYMLQYSIVGPISRYAHQKSVILEFLTA